jgi:hypothetical protein
MVFSKKNAGKWVASKDDKVIETDKSLENLVNKISDRKDKDRIVFARVPTNLFFAGSGVSL